MLDTPAVAAVPLRATAIAVLAIWAEWAVPATAQVPPATASAAAPKTAAEPCVAVDIAGQRAGNVDCAAARLDAAAKAAQSRAQNDPRLTVPDASAPAPVVGTANVAATRQRLGSNFGHSAQPQRPPSSAPAPALPRRP